MRAVVVGSGRVGSTLSKALVGAGWEVVVIDENEQALELLGEDWRGAFVVGHGMDAGVLEEAGIREADAVICATDGDNTNIVVAQIATRRYGVERVAARVHDPARAEFFSDRGFTVVSPVKAAISELSAWALEESA
ncbi:MAG TPA: TrkA family potassium uptake protein [Gaiellaceae bacterium]|jgi:trk system potassium uptake protein TrkA|nr:TrkA family potassium uptake protein [Gaiellaceae bacterium]